MNSALQKADVTQLRATAACLAAAMCFAGPVSAEVAISDLPDIAAPCLVSPTTAEALEAGILSAGWQPVEDDNPQYQALVVDTLAVQRGFDGASPEDRVLNRDFLRENIVDEPFLALTKNRFERDGAALLMGTVDQADALSVFCLVMAEEMDGADSLLAAEGAETLAGPVRNYSLYLDLPDPTYLFAVQLWRSDLPDADELGLAGHYGLEINHASTTEE